MADIIGTPWADDSETRRAPTAAERALGFVCGAADPDLFNYLLWYQDRWFQQAGEDASIAVDPDDPQTLTKIINALILLAGAGSSTPELLNPIYPYVSTNGGVFLLSTVSGQISIPDGTTFVHRGSTQHLASDYDLATERTFATVANKTYHLRWQYNAGTPIFVLKDLASAGYNPGALDEDDQSFDSTYDDMLIAKVVTNGSNDLTVTALKNLHQLSYEELMTGVSVANPGANLASFDFDATLNWARTPTHCVLTLMNRVSDGSAGDDDFQVGTNGTPNYGMNFNRYAMDNRVISDYTTATGLRMQFSAWA